MNIQGMVFVLLCGLAMLVNNFLRLYAEEPPVVADEFPIEIDAGATARNASKE